jgi:hypothetical protein
VAQETRTVSEYRVRVDTEASVRLLVQTTYTIEQSWGLIRTTPLPPALPYELPAPDTYPIFEPAYM